MKKSLLKFLPLAVAVMLATSCSKDENNNTENTPETTEVVNKKGIVQIPFSVGIANAKSLSKVAFSNDGSTINFEEDDVNTVELTVSGDGVSGSLPLVYDGSYKFSGTLSVEIDKETEFTGSGISLQGTFTQNKGSETSNSNFEELLNHCAHTYNTTFNSTDADLTLVDQNFYVYVERAKEMTIGNVSSFTQGNYYVFPISTTVEGKTVEPCKLYTIGKAVQSVTINDVPTETKVWGNDAFDVTVSITPSDATNQTVTWSCTNAEVSYNGNGIYSVLITGNEGGKATISAIVDGVSSQAAEITVDPDYVDLGTGYVYWKTSDDDPMSGYWAVQKNAPPDYYFNLLWNANLVERSGTKFTNKNGSGASITLQSAHYWTSMVNSSTNAGVYFIVNSDGYTSQQGSRDDVKNVRAVRSQQ